MKCCHFSTVGRLPPDFCLLEVDSAVQLSRATHSQVVPPAAAAAAALKRDKSDSEYILFKQRSPWQTKSKHFPSSARWRMEWCVVSGGWGHGGACASSHYRPFTSSAVVFASESLVPVPFYYVPRIAAHK